MKMERKQKGKRTLAWLMAFALCLSPLSYAESSVQADEREAGEDSRTPQAPVIGAEKGEIIWDCVYFGNYWQSKYITQPGNRPEQGEDDVIHTDTDGTKYMVREDKSCYKYEPIKWRVLSVSADGTDAFLMADQNLDIQPYHTEYSDTVTWEDSHIRTWLNQDFLDAAFTAEEQEAITQTEIENKKNPYAEAGEALEGNNTRDKVYLPSLDEITTRAYGFTPDLGDTVTRTTNNTDFTASGGTAKADAFSSYSLRTLAMKKDHVSLVQDLFGTGNISMDGTYSVGIAVDSSIRPVLHLDLTQTDLWTYAGRVNQKHEVIDPDAEPWAPEGQREQSDVTMEPGQIYPKNPVIYEDDLTKNTWDCIYFGTYYNTKLAPDVLSLAGEHDTIVTDGEGIPYLVRHEEGYFQYEPIKWRVLSINEDGTDAFLMADQVLDVQPYYGESDVEITWEKSDIRYWLATDFMDTAFSEEQKAVIRETKITTEDNPWSGEAGGNDTTDRVYLLSIEEALNPSYGFGSSNEEEGTRRMAATDYVKAEDELNGVNSELWMYWLRSPGARKGYPATVGFLGDGTIQTEATNPAPKKLGVRPVMHVDLTNTALWSYAGQVTPNGVVKKPAEPPVDDTQSTETEASEKAPTETPESQKPTETPESQKATETSESQKATETSESQKATETPESQKPVVKKPGKPVIKKLTNKAGKKVTLTLGKKVSGATGYQVAYAAKSSMKGQKTKTFKGTSVTIKGLKKNKTYYFQVRAYTKKKGKTVYGDWGKKKSIKIKK